MKNIIKRGLKYAKNMVSPSPRTLGTIYMLHRCSPIDKNNLYWNEHMKVSPEFLKNFLTERRKTHDFISLDEFTDISKNKVKIKKPFIIMTFDDGYRDNYEYALPVFEETRIPFTVYITNSFPDKTAFLWWYMLEDILIKNNTVILPDGKKFACSTKEEKESAFIELRSIILNLDQENTAGAFKELFYNYDIPDQSYYNDKLCLDWDEIKEMSGAKTCAIGAHTVNHKTLNKLTDLQLKYEIMEGRKLLEKHIEKPVKHFSYPFGTANEIGPRESEFIRTCGFDTVCYAAGGNIHKHTIQKRLELPRVFLGELSR
jgi:peptidoglycan/xylan/chitin deacetylase (PgdA/CDA1 family)